MTQRIDWIWLFLSPRGRLTRLPYFLAMMLITLVSGLFVYRHLVASMPINFENPWATPGLIEMASFVTLVTVWPMIALSAKRAADIGLPPFIGGLVALFGFVVITILSLVPGKDGPNQYGSNRDAPPAPRE